ncbi:MAG: 16S rRNA (cytosine(967)-C(5))-methyltransferase RsmB [Planctomycetaceae bacterium]
MSPRDLAYDVLCRWLPESASATAELESRLGLADFSPSERGLTKELVNGVIRRRATVDALLAAHSRRPLRQIEHGLQTLLHLGIYQLVFLSGAPAYAIVDETVELARRLGHEEWSGFANGILRAVARSVTDEVAHEPGRRAVPLTAGTYRLFDCDTFPDPDREPAGYFAVAFSFPAWLVGRWCKRYVFDELLRLGFWFNAPGHLTLRANTLCTSRENLLGALRSAGIDATPIGDEGVRLASSGRITSLPGYDEGWFAVQDESALSAATLLAPRPGESVLDLCAAPGGKTTHLAALMQNDGKIVACDVSADRLARVDENCRRLRTTIVETRLVRRDSSDLPEGPFDTILLDAPCSNTGVLGKRPEVRWRLKPNEIEELAALQIRLLAAAAARLRPGGRLVYSTCSIEPEENERVVAATVRAESGLEILEERQHVPGQPADGGYQALLRLAGDER